MKILMWILILFTVVIYFSGCATSSPFADHQIGILTIEGKGGLDSAKRQIALHCMRLGFDRFKVRVLQYLSRPSLDVQFECYIQPTDYDVDDKCCSEWKGL